MADDEVIGDRMPDDASMMEVHVGAVRNLFNAIDPSPLLERDLDPRIEEFIVSWGRSLPRTKPIALRIFTDAAPAGDDARAVPNAVRDYFAGQSASARRRLHQLFSIGRTSLVIGLAALALALVIGSLAETALGDSHLGEVIRETFSIGGWVAMWRPLEIFLYDWWPIQRERRLFDRFAEMPVQILVKDTIDHESII